jgi:hypothetical protein
MRLADLLESMASSYGQTFKSHAALVRELAKLVKHDGALAEQQEQEPRKLIGWRTDDYLNETADKKIAENWSVHYSMLPIFDGDPHTKLYAAPVAQPLTDHCPMCDERLAEQRENQQWQADVAKGRALLAAAEAKP